MGFFKKEKNRVKSYPRIKFQEEYGTWPLWIQKSKSDINEPVDPNDLPISQALIEDIESWDDRYQATLDRNYPPDSISLGDAFEAEGKELAKRLALELKDEYCVTYRHENKSL